MYYNLYIKLIYSSYVFILLYYNQPANEIFIYLESACHDEQNDSQSFKIGARIAKLW